jgi:hypothetical protein
MYKPVWIGLSAVVMLAAACADDTGSASTRDEAELVHVHDVLVPPGDGEVLLATHTGLYALRDGDLVPVGERFDDLMAATIESDGTLIASGHPDLLSGAFRVEDKPPLLGLVESEDGVDWTARSLLGDADFHALVVRDDLIIGADSTSERVLVSSDGGVEWSERAGTAQLLDLVVDPSDVDRMVGIELDRGLVVTADGGDTWTDLDGPALVDLAWTERALVGLDDQGELWRAPSDTLSWERVGAAPGAEALGVDGQSIYAFVAPNRLVVSTDDGESWGDAGR